MAASESRSVEYLPAGVAVDPYQGEPTLDPELARIRDAELKADAPAEAEQPVTRKSTKKK